MRQRTGLAVSSGSIGCIRVRLCVPNASIREGVGSGGSMRKVVRMCLLLGYAFSSSQAQANGAQVQAMGRVIDAVDGRGLEAVAIEVQGSGRQSTDSSGRFVLKSIAVGRHVLRARRLGYQEVIDSVVIQPGDTTELR